MGTLIIEIVSTFLPLVIVLTFSKATYGVKNVLFLASDDMRPELGAYAGPDAPSSIHPDMYTPNLDALARRSLLLKRAYVQQAVCSPSRTSLLTGRRPETTHVYDLISYWRVVGGNYTTIPQYFKNHGYTTAGIGKIFHPGEASGNNDPVSWTEKYYWGQDYYGTRVTWRAVTEKEWRKKPLIDQQRAQAASDALKKHGQIYKDTGKPFFIALGFNKPHLPFEFPDKFLKYYPNDTIRLPGNPFSPGNMPEIAWSNYDELRGFNDIQMKYGIGTPNATFPDVLVKTLRQSYYATISYVDDLIGSVLQTLKEEGLDNSTIITFWGDHGWQLGEHGEWCKHTNFELATHAPMMVHIPGVTDKTLNGIPTRALIEFVDLFPTLAEAAGLPPVPLCPQGNETTVETCTEGVSMLPLTANPEQEWKKAIFSQYPRMATSGDIVMGYTMRTDRYRYTEWREYKPWPQYTSLGDLFHGYSVELYDHNLDPEENYNRAFDSAYNKIRKNLHEQMLAGWREAMPNSQKNQ